MSDGATSVMTYKWNGDASQAAAALLELKARLRDTNREALGLAKEVVKGNADARRSLIDVVAAADRYKGKFREIQEAAKAAQAQANGAAAGAGKTGMVMQSLAFGLDDAMQQFANTGRISSVLQAAGNNLTMIASAFGAIPVIATAATVAVASFWAKSAERNDDAQKKLDAYKKSMEDLAKAEARARGVDEKQGELKQAEGTVWTAEQRVAEAKRKLGEAEAMAAMPGMTNRVKAWWQGGVGEARGELTKAMDEARVAKEGFRQKDKEAAAAEAAKTFGPASDDMRRIMRDSIAGGATPEQARETVFQKMSGHARTEREKGGLRDFVGTLAKEEETNRVGMAAASGLEDPMERRAREMQAAISRAEIDLSRKERVAGDAAAAMGMRKPDRETTAALAKDREAIDIQRDQLRELQLLREEQKRAKDERYRSLPPKGLGEAAR
jgi:hypothetical protein